VGAFTILPDKKFFWWGTHRFWWLSYSFDLYFSLFDGGCIDNWRSYIGLAEKVTVMPSGLGDSQMYCHTSSWANAAFGMTVASGKKIVHNIFTVHENIGFWAKTHAPIEKYLVS